MEEHRFTVTFQDAFSADLVVGGEWSLYDFAEFIIQTVGFDFDHAFQFCDNLKNPYRSKECYTLFADIGEDADDPGVKNTPVSAVFRPRRKMLFHFDYGDDWFFTVACTGVKESDASEPFRKVLAKKGTPPEQYPETDDLID